MSSKERTGRRDLLYSTWHREESFRRFMTPVEAAKIEQIDIDSAEACPFCHKTLALVETKNSEYPPSRFPTRNTALLARDAGIPAFCVTYTCACGVTGESHETKDGCDIAHLQRQQIAPVLGEVIQHEPREYAIWLLALRERCQCLDELGDETASNTDVGEEVA